MGDAIVVSPTVVVDLRYGLSRINTKNLSGNKEGFDDYQGFGTPANVQAIMALPGAAPVVNPNGYTGGNGGGSNWSAVSAGTFGTKREFQTNHSVTGSITKVRGRWNHKAGVEFRNLLSNYWDLEQASVAMPSPFAHSGGNFNFQYTTASGGVASLVTTNAQRGVNAAAMLLGTGVWWIRPGANVQPALSQKYFAVYSQNDWRASSKLTINLGLRWELQPGPTERFNRMSAWDFEATNAFGTKGAIAFPGVDGYSRNLWDTTYDNWGPRVGAAYSVNDRTVLRGGFGITYLPSNTGYFSGPTDYGSANFSAGVTQTAYGTTPRGVPVIRFSDPAPIAPAIGGDPTAPQVYGIGEARFDRALQERAGASMELLHRAGALQELDGVDRLHRVGEPEPVQSVVSRSRTCRASPRTPSPSGATSTSPATARSIRPRSSCPTRSSLRAARSCRSPARWVRRRSRGRTRCSRIRC